MEQTIQDMIREKEDLAYHIAKLLLNFERQYGVSIQAITYKHKWSFTTNNGDVVTEPDCKIDVKL